MRQLTSFTIPLFVLALFAFSTPVHAAEETHSCAIERSRLDWRVDQNTGNNSVKNCAIPGFLVSKGTLTSIAINATGSTDTVQRMENKDVSPHTMFSEVTVVADLKGKNNSSLLTVNIPAASATLQAAAYDGAVDFEGTSGKTFEVEYASKSASQTITDQATLEQLSTGTPMNFPVYALANWSCNGSGNAACAVDTYAAVNINVTYTYNPYTPDLSLQPCHQVTIRNGETSVITVGGSNGGQIATQKPIVIKQTLPACIEFIEVTTPQWQCTTAPIAQSKTEVTCEFKGTVPAGAFVPDLGIKVRAKDCAQEAVTYQVAIQTSDEVKVQNNSILCNAGVEAPPLDSQNPSILGEQTTPTTAPSPSPRVAAQNTQPSDRNGNVLSALANTGIFLVIPIIIALVVAGIALVMRKPKENKAETQTPEKPTV